MTKLMNVAKKLRKFPKPKIMEEISRNTEMTEKIEVINTIKMAEK